MDAEHRNQRLRAAPYPGQGAKDITQTGDTSKFVHSSETSYGQQDYAFKVVADGTEQLMPEGSFPTEAPFKILSSKAGGHGSALTLLQKQPSRRPGNSDGNLDALARRQGVDQNHTPSLPMGEFDTKAHFENSEASRQPTQKLSRGMLNRACRTESKFAVLPQTIKPLRYVFLSLKGTGVSPSVVTLK